MAAFAGIRNSFGSISCARHNVHYEPTPMTPWAYLLYELAWALPVILIQWAVAGRELWRWRRLLSVSVGLATAYLGACDAFALGHGIWRVDPARVLGIYAGPLPLEELVFYFVTSLMAAQGYVMIVGFLRERNKKAKHPPLPPV